ncbi:3-dehydrosphinganine reductase [Ceratobasidium sp. UAMH 11750]|nr:3-dehydrosphinganine reductase [Ceratobasidium sp. UAMH 11750]
MSNLATLLYPLVATIIALALSTMGLFTKKWSPKDKHCYVTGGSMGLGLSLALILVKNGAHVSIVARNKEKLDKAIAQLEAVRVSPNQIIKSYSFSVADSAGSKAALEAACEPFDGRAPDAMFLCAGAAKPRFFVEDDEEDLQNAMTNAYWIQAYSAHVGLKKMVRQKVEGKIVFVGSTLSLMTFVGYSNYSPGKYALRALADTLASECQLYNIGVHIFFPCTMKTEGWEEEMKLKPEITKKIEETDDGLTTEQAAQAMYRGVQLGHQHIAGDIITTLFRANARSSAPMHNPFVDSVLAFVSWIAVPFWRMSVDSMIKGHRQQHAEYLTKTGHMDK